MMQRIGQTLGRAGQAALLGMACEVALQAADLPRRSEPGEGSGAERGEARPAGSSARARSGMRQGEAKARLPQTKLPEFWVGDVDGLADRFASLKTAEVKVIARSPGGRPLHLVGFGEAEPLPSRANFNSAIGGQEASAYCDKAARKRPVLLFLGPVHGHEVEGLTGLVNLIQILETGRDLRGKGQPELQSLGRQCRLLIIPAGNPDGTARFEPRSLHGLSEDDLRFWGQGTWSDGSFCDWPECKRQHPMVGTNVGFLGCYFDDRGVNPMHDEFFAPLSTEAPAILKAAKETAPDLVVSLHSHENKPAFLRPAYVPLEMQAETRELAQRCHGLMDQRGLPHAGLFAVQAESGRVPAAFNLSSALYHISGANSFTFECPHGLTNASACQVNLDQILDIQLTLYEGMIRFAVEQKAR